MNSNLLNVAFFAPVAVVAVVVGGLVVAFARRAHGSRTALETERWARGAYAIWTGGEDCSAWPAERAQNALSSWYDAKGAGSFWNVIASLRAGRTGNIAWDRVRAIDLLRIGLAAGFIDREQCMTEIRHIGAELQSAYQSWEDLARAFEQGMQEWQSGRGVRDPQQTGRVQRNLPTLRQQIWPLVRFEAPLGAD